MHSSIFQISRDVIPDDDRITPNDYDESELLGREIGYVTGWGPETSGEELNQLSTVLMDAAVITRTDDGVKLTVTDKLEYFKAAYDDFKKYTARLMDMTEEQFAASGSVGDAKQVVNSAVEAYVYGGSNYRVNFDGEELTLTEFMRQAENGQDYFVGAVLNYHA